MGYPGHIYVCVYTTPRLLKVRFIGGKEFPRGAALRSWLQSSEVLFLDNGTLKLYIIVPTADDG